jgi:metallo-beta-lactamase family protein
MSIRLRFHGAAGAVTGSCFLLETSRARVLVDCGMFQGSKTEKELNYRDFPWDARKIDALALTHAHIDHSGLAPKLVKAGFKGPIFATPASVDLCSIMLRDSGHIQEVEVEQLNKRNQRRGRRGEITPIYTPQDAERTMDLFRAAPYGAWFSLAAGVRGRFWNAGHLLGSASLEIEAQDEKDAAPQRLLFSGDIGPAAKLLQRAPEGPSGVDYLICESTYGDRDREETTPEKRRALLAQEVKGAARPGGALLIPSFAVERTQELLVDLVALMNARAIPQAPIYIDSPLATRATAAFAKHAHELDGGQALLEAVRSPHVHFTQTTEQSRALDNVRDFHIVIAASGMCEAGRIRHRLRNWLWREEAVVLMVGFQAQGTLGRILLEGATRVRIQGDDIDVRARIRSLDLYSGHADGPELAAWVKARGLVRRNVFLVHGEDASLAGLAQRLQGVVEPERILTPALDSCYALGAEGARLVDGGAPHRLAPEAVGRLDWHNDLSRLLIDIGAQVDAAADDKAKAVVIRRLRRALEEGG